MGPPVLLEPIDKILEWDQILHVEMEASWSHLDELLEHLVFGDIGKHDVLWVGWQDSKPVWDPTWSFFLLFLKAGLKVFIAVGVQELGVGHNFSDVPVAWNDVPFDDLSQALKLVIVDDES